MKLAGALAVPLVALVVVTALEVVQSSEDASQVNDQSALAEISVGPASVLSRLEDERNAAAVYLLGAQDAFALPRHAPRQMMRWRRSNRRSRAAAATSRPPTARHWTRWTD
jgi:hypothetical protein